MARKVKRGSRVGKYAFLAGVLLAILAGIFTDLLAPAVVTLVLAILGLVVGFMNITAKEVTEFLVAAVALMLAGVANVSLSLIPWVGNYLQAILVNITTFVAMGAVIVALKAVWVLEEYS